MKILLLTQYFSPEVGAAQARLEAQTKEFLRLGHEVEVITCMPNYPDGKIYSGYGGLYSSEKLNGVLIQRFWVYASQGKGISRLLNYLSFMFTAFLALFQSRKADLVFVNSGPLFLAVPGYVMSVVYRCPLVFNVSDLWPRSVEHLATSLSGRLFVRASEYLEAWIYRRADIVNAITDGVEKTLIEEKNVPRKKVLRLFNGVDLDLFSGLDLETKALEIRRKHHWENDFVFIYPGNHGYAHALENVLLAGQYLEEQGESGIQFVLIGGGSEKPRLQEMAKELKLKNVHFFSPVPMSELPPYLKMADMGLIHVKNTPLANETRPAKMFPLMAAKKAILFCGFGEGAELLQAIQGGKILSPENPQALAHAVIELRDHRDKLKTWAQNNYDFLEKNLTTKKIVQQWFHDLNFALERNKK